MKKGFTLAEVLITLTIIGVIAAITIPNLIQSYKKHQVEVGVKEAYSILSNAIKMSESENGSLREWDVSSWNTEYYKKIIPYLKISKNCGYGVGNSLCMKPPRGLNGESYSYNSYVYNVILENGMSLGIFSWGSGVFFVDIDGPNKGKSTIGFDIFIFGTLENRFNTTITFFAGLPDFRGSSSQSAAINLSKNTSQLLSSEVRGGCNLSTATDSTFLSGTQCAAAIAKNSWKIPDDYPVKKW